MNKIGGSTDLGVKLGTITGLPILKFVLNELSLLPSISTTTSSESIVSS